MTTPTSSRFSPDIVFAEAVRKLPAELKLALEGSELLDPDLPRAFPQSPWRERSECLRCKYVGGGLIGWMFISSVLENPCVPVSSGTLDLCTVAVTQRRRHALTGVRIVGKRASVCGYGKDCAPALRSLVLVLVCSLPRTYHC